MEIENSKRKKAEPKEKKVQEAQKKEIIQELEVQVAEIRKEKKEKKLKEKIVEEKPKLQPKIGDRVRMIDGKAVGVLDAIEKGKAVVNYGMFTSKVDLETLELVEAKKIKK